MTWQRVPLKDVGTWYGGATPSKSNPAFWTAGTIPWLSPKDMGPEVLISTQDHITRTAVERSPVKLVPGGSTAVVVRSGIIERTIPVSLVPFDTTLNQDMKAVQPRADIDARWIAWGLRAFERELLRDTRKAGTTVASIEWPRFQAFEIPVPPLEDQCRIIDLLEDHLSRLDAAESLVVTSLRRLMSLRRSVLAELHDGDPTTLGELAVDCGYGTSEKCVPEGPGPAVVRIPNLVHGRIDLSDEKRIASDSVDVERYFLAPGDLLIVRTNGSVDLIGRSAVVQDGVDAAFASYLIRYQLRPDRVMPEWVQAMLSTPQVRAKIEKLAASSAGQHNLSLGKLNPLELLVPPLNVQAARLSRLAEIEDQVNRLRVELSAAESRGFNLRRSLLTAAFSGRLTDSKPQEERWESVLGV